jgi:hypothetical protein
MKTGPASIPGLSLWIVCRSIDWIFTPARTTRHKPVASRRDDGYRNKVRGVYHGEDYQA